MWEEKERKKEEKEVDTLERRIIKSCRFYNLHSEREGQLPLINISLTAGAANDNIVVVGIKLLALYKDPLIIYSHADTPVANLTWNSDPRALVCNVVGIVCQVAASGLDVPGIVVAKPDAGIVGAADACTHPWSCCYTAHASAKRTQVGLLLVELLEVDGTIATDIAVNCRLVFQSQPLPCMDVQFGGLFTCDRFSNSAVVSSARASAAKLGFSAKIWA
jgi:hypothetical protein